MKLNYIVAVLITLLTLINTFGQDSDTVSLTNKNYSELKDLFYNAVDKNNSHTKKIASYTLKKGRKDKNYKVVANSYLNTHFKGKVSLAHIKLISYFVIALC